MMEFYVYTKGSARMITIGLTGSIACGKSHISDTLRSLGAYIIDGDELSRRLTAPGGAALPELRAHFGDDVFFPDGTLDRKALGAIVFTSDEKRQLLDEIMQPAILRLIHHELGKARESGAAVTVLDMPLLFEKKLDTLCSSVWCTVLPEEMQLRRLMARDNCTEEQARNRMASQMSTKEKATLSQVLIDTSGEMEETDRLVVEAWQKLLTE